MSLQVTFDISCAADCDAFKFFENTGIISPSNTEAWGAPNPVVGDALTAVVAVQFPDGTTLLPAGTPVEFNLFTHGFPRTTADLFELSYEDFGGTEDADFPEGIYYITYTVSGEQSNIPFTSTDGNYFLFACQTRCCLNKAYLKIKDACGCDSKEFCKVMTGLTNLDVACFAATCGDIEIAAELLKESQDICDDLECTNC